MNYAVALDIGATKAAVAAVGEDFSVTQKFSVPTGSHRNIWRNIESCIQSILDTQEGECMGIGIGTAGPLNAPAGSISPVNIDEWENFKIIDCAEKLIGGLPTSLIGDVAALVLAEHSLGIGRGEANLLGMVVSTGIGGGLVIDGKLFLGDSGNASFLGHHIINFMGPLCRCGRNGCLEAYSSGTSMANFARTNGWKSADFNFLALAASARAGDEIALEAIEFGTRVLAMGIVNICAINDIHNVVIGGGVAEAGEIFWKPLQSYLEQEKTKVTFLKDLQVRKASLSSVAGLIGAALPIIQKSKGN